MLKLELVIRFNKTFTCAGEILWFSSAGCMSVDESFMLSLRLVNVKTKTVEKYFIQSLVLLR